MQILIQLALSYKQVSLLLKNIPEPLARKKLTQQAMSPIEQVFHLIEVTHACNEMINDREYTWGAYKPEAESLEAAVALYNKARETLINFISSLTDETVTKHLSTITNYILLHEAYHVGQLCNWKLENIPDWNPYEIYI